MTLDILELSEVRWHIFGEHKLQSGRYYIFRNSRQQRSPASMRWLAPRRRRCLSSGSQLMNESLLSDSEHCSDKTDYKCVMGRYRLEETSENGKLLTGFCGYNNLVIGGALFSHRPVPKITCFSRDRHTENQINHFCSSIVDELATRCWRTFSRCFGCSMEEQCSERPSRMLLLKPAS